MAKEGLKTWFKQNWVDIGSKRKDGSFAKCGRSKQKKDAKTEVSKMRASSESEIECRRDREDLPLPGNGQLPMWDLNLQT